MTDILATVRYCLVNLSAMFLSEQCEIEIIWGLKFWLSIKYDRLCYFRQYCNKLPPPLPSRPLFILGVNRSWKLVVSSHGQPEEQNIGLAVIYSYVSYIEELVDVLFTVLSMWHTRFVQKVSGLTTVHEVDKAYGVLTLIVFNIIPFRSYTLRPTLLPLLETFCKLLFQDV